MALFKCFRKKTIVYNTKNQDIAQKPVQTTEAEKLHELNHFYGFIIFIIVATAPLLTPTFITYLGQHGLWYQTSLTVYSVVIILTSWFQWD